MHMLELLRTPLTLHGCALDAAGPRITHVHCVVQRAQATLVLSMPPPAQVTRSPSGPLLQGRGHLGD